MVLHILYINNVVHLRTNHSPVIRNRRRPIPRLLHCGGWPITVRRPMRGHARPHRRSVGRRPVLGRHHRLHVLHLRRGRPAALLEERRVDVGSGALRRPLGRAAGRAHRRRAARSHGGRALHVRGALGREALLHGRAVPVRAGRGALVGHAAGHALGLWGTLELLLGRGLLLNN